MTNARRTIPPDLENITPILIGVWRRLHKLAGPPDVLQTREFRGVVAAVKQLQEMSVEGKSLVGTNYLDDPNLAGAYFLYQWVVHYQQGLSLLGELPQAPRRVLDVCSGGAPFAFAALRHGASEVYALDQSQLALKLGGEVCGRYGLTVTMRKCDCRKPQLPVEGKFDLIIVGHCLKELFPSNQKGWQEEQKRFLDRLMARLTDDGCLLVVDDSFQEANKRLLSLRDQYVQEGIAIQAPCVWRGECPALKTANSPCYAQREFEKPHLIKEIQRAASINLSSLKMSYVIFRAKGALWPYNGAQNLYRVISPPVEAFSGKRFYLCGTDGKKQLSTRLQEHPADSRAFEYLKRGELIAFEDALEGEKTIDIVEGTKVKVVAPCGKPVPESINE